MNPAQRTQLTKTLSAHVAAIAADLRAQMLAAGEVRERARRLHADEQVGDDFEVWTDLLSRRAAVLWVLKTVYVRVLEDRGLLRPGRLLDPEAEQLFDKLAPNLGPTAFLVWVFRDLASPRGGLPELFAPQPAEVAVPADALSRALIGFWRGKDADTGFQWSFGEEVFAGELMGDLYQELDPVVKDRYALCQTPDFVRDFMLGQTLEPAIRELGADQVRLLDPACGSGHFLLDALRRLCDATAAQHRDWPRRKVVDHALDRVVGIDLNDYACALARARLVMTAAELAGVSSLADAAGFHPHVYWADGLEQIERDDEREAVQLDLLGPKSELPPRAVLTRPDVRAVLRPILRSKFQVVVGNPPYITERDPARKEYHRETVGSRKKKTRRYVSAYREYSLAAPFIERCLQLAEPGGWIGLIVGNNFMKREFGKPLIEEVLAATDLELVVDTSQAFIPHHGTPTVILSARNRPPEGETVRAVMGKRGETGTPDDPAKGRVWSSIVEGFATVGFENEFVSVADVPRATFGKHPWSLGGGGAAELKAKLETIAVRALEEAVREIGRTTVCGEDPVYIMSPDAAERLGVRDLIVPLAIGEVVRDWAIQPTEWAVYPYLSLGGDPIPPSHPGVLRYLWHFRTLLRGRSVFGKSPEERGGPWYQHLEHYAERLQTPLAIAFAFVATHNHFVLDQGGKVFNRSAPVIKLQAGATQDEHLALLGLLNSSTVCFWLRQVCQPKGGESTGTKKQSEAWARRVEIDATKLARLPIVDANRDEFLKLARTVCSLSDELAEWRPGAILSRGWEPGALASTIELCALRRATNRRKMIALQERLDWTAYVAYGIARPELLAAAHSWPVELDSEERPFAIRMAREVRDGSLQTHWFEEHGASPTVDIPRHWPASSQELWGRLVHACESVPNLGLLEQPEQKRKWEPTDPTSEIEEACRAWIGDRVEGVVRGRGRPMSRQQLVVALQDDTILLEVIRLYVRRQDFDLSTVVDGTLRESTVPSHPWHVYTEMGLGKRGAWEETWRLQRLEDAGEKVATIPIPPEYSQGSRGKSRDFIRDEYWKLRGSLDVPKERFIAFTEVPGRAAGETLYGWAGWTPTERVKALLALDEECEDQGIALSDRIALLDSAWRLIPDVIRDDAATGARLKAELAALAGPDGPSRVLLDDWKQRFPPPTKGRGRGKKAKAPASVVDETEDDE